MSGPSGELNHVDRRQSIRFRKERNEVSSVFPKRSEAVTSVASANEGGRIVSPPNPIIVATL